MKVLLNSRDMKLADATTIKEYGIPSMVLMERAALGVISYIDDLELKDATFAVICGNGNNGGDGFAIARLLYLKGYDVLICFVGEEEKLSQDCKQQKLICEKYNVPYTTDVHRIEGRNVLIDAIFGIGITRDISGTYFDVISYLNSLDALKIAVDIPSGISSDDGKVCGVAIKADATVTFGFGKIGQFVFPGKSYCGNIRVVDIGISEHSLKECTSVFHSLENVDLQMLPTRAIDANKGSVGKVLLIAGCDEMAGAAYLSACSALRCGCGLVKVYTTEKNRDIILSKIPEAIVICYDKFNEKELLELMQWADAVAIGPGIGQSKISAQMLSHVIKFATVPVVIDADALNLIAKQPNLLKQPHTEIIVTPHIGEMARLTDNSNLYVLDHKLSIAQDFSNDYQVTCVLKDASTIITFPYASGYINTSGSPGMATAGSGDVLTGIIVSLIAQGVLPSQAAPLGVYLHGLGGEMAAHQKSIHGMLASDIIDGIMTIFLERGW